VDGGCAMTRAPALLLLLLGGCSGVQTPLAPHGDQADSLFGLLVLTVVVGAGIYALVIGFLGWSTRRATTARGAPVVEPDDTGLTRGLWVWAGIVIAGLTLLITASFIAERSLAGARDRETLRVSVTGHQWWWRIEYRDPATGALIETANELHLPIGRTARIELGAADVIHSFWVPNLAGKLDMIPGRANSIDVTPRKLGWFRGQCAEFCGAQHTHMAFDVKVDTSEEFAAWLAAQARPAAPPADPATARGMQIVTQGACAMCHAIRGTSATARPGPDLTHVGARRTLAAGTILNTRGGMQGWIAQPQALKPGASMPAVPLAPADADAVSRYLESLK
jgi:cytochrome c oxidase subunit 2